MENFEKEQMFEDQIHERTKFKVNIDGNDYLGVYHKGEIDWMHPHPERDLTDQEVEIIESQVHGKLNRHK